METRLIPVVALATGLVSLMIYLTPPPASAQSAGAGASAGGASAGAGASAGGGSASGGAGASAGGASAGAGASAGTGGSGAAGAGASAGGGSAGAGASTGDGGAAGGAGASAGGASAGAGAGTDGSAGGTAGGGAGTGPGGAGSGTAAAGATGPGGATGPAGAAGATGPGATGPASATSVAAANCLDEECLLRVYLGSAHPAGNTTVAALTSTQMAAILYRSGNTRAAKELLCEQREAYDAFRRTATPCLARADWELKGTTTQALTSEAPNGFRARDYRTKSDCLTAAYTNHVPLSACNGR
jgi:hypothetical protein